MNKSTVIMGIVLFVFFAGIAIWKLTTHEPPRPLLPIDGKCYVHWTKPEATVECCFEYCGVTFEGKPMAIDPEANACIQKCFDDTIKFMVTNPHLFEDQQEVR